MNLFYTRTATPISAILMPPKPQVFKSPDGREFTSRAEWRDYMILTFFSFKNKKDESMPLIKEVLYGGGYS